MENIEHVKYPTAYPVEEVENLLVLSFPDDSLWYSNSPEELGGVPAELNIQDFMLGLTR